MDQWLQQLIVFLVLFFGTLLCGLLPIYTLINWQSIQHCCRNWSKTSDNAEELKPLASKPDCERILNSNWLRLARSFAFGVLFAVCFLHLLPENADSFQKVLGNDQVNNNQTKSNKKAQPRLLPYNEIITCLGFMLVYLLDLLMHMFVHHLSNKRKPIPASSWSPLDAALPVHANSNASQSSVKGTEHHHHFDYHLPAQEQVNVARAMHACDHASKQHSHVLPLHFCEKDTQSSGQMQRSITLPTIEHVSTKLSGQSETDSKTELHSRIIVKKRPQLKSGMASHSNPKTSTGYGTLSLDCSQSISLPCSSQNEVSPVSSKERRLMSLMRCLLIIGALSLHAVFEGFAMGITKDTLLLYQLLGAVMLHKALISLVLGLNVLCETNSLRDCALGLLVFSGMAPIGQLFGAWLARDHIIHQTPSIQLCVANALATGSLVYVTFFEIRPKVEHHSNLQGPLHLLAALIGFSLIFASITLIPH